MVNAVGERNEEEDEEGGKKERKAKMQKGKAIILWRPRGR